MKKENIRKNVRITLLVIIWFLFLFVGLYTYDWINKLLVLMGSGYLASKIAWWLINEQ